MSDTVYDFVAIGAGPRTISGLTASPCANFIQCSWPSRQIVSSSHSDSALTTETPTPCRPPETLYELLLNLPPACRTVRMTIAASTVLPPTSIGPVGMPRPLSSTETEPSGLSSISTRSQ